MIDPAPGPDATIAERFEVFHDANPHVYVVLVRLAREWMERTGRHKLGMKSLYERARWDLAIATNSPDFRLNNDFTPFYSRLLMAEHPDLADLFDLRSSEADAWLATYKAAS